MLQQTQVATVIPYFERFMQSFTDVHALASAPVEAVLAHWSGLGYYARGRNLHKAAQLIVSQFYGQLPDNAEDLCRLPGIGLSTAHAILSLAYQQPKAICDGNVKRVLARWLALDMPIESTQAQQQLWHKAQQLQSQRRPGDYTQAIMDLGANVCTRHHPQCEHCPIAQDCAAYASHYSVTHWPKRRPKPSKPVINVDMFLYIHAQHGVWLVEPSAQTGIWAGLYQLPQKPLTILPEFKQLPVVKHVFTHQTWFITPRAILIDNHDASAYFYEKGLWYNPSDSSASLARPAIVDKLWQHWLSIQEGK